MRDSFGGAFAIKLFLVFIAIYIGFTAVALNYAKAFKVKNQIISYIENHEESNIDNMTALSIMNLENFIDEEILGKMDYSITENICPRDMTSVKYCKNGILIELSGKAENTAGKYYTVSTFVNWNLPFLNILLQQNGSDDGREAKGYWKISGQTRLIVNE